MMKKYLCFCVALLVGMALMTGCKNVYADSYFVTWERNGSFSGEWREAGDTIMNEMKSDISSLSTKKPTNLFVLIGEKYRLEVKRKQDQDKDQAVKTCSDAANVRILDGYSKTSSPKDWYVTQGTKDDYDLYVIVNIEYETGVPLRTVAAYYYHVLKK